MKIDFESLMIGCASILLLITAVTYYVIELGSKHNDDRLKKQKH